jgi:hypothetical protein
LVIGIYKKIMKAKITFIRNVPRGIMLVFKLEDGRSAHTYTGKQYRNYRFWKDLLIGDSIVGLKWEDETKKLISADSVVYPLS